MSGSRFAIAHKDYDVRGGGEILSEELCRTFDAPMYVGRRNADAEPDSLKYPIREIGGNRLLKRMIDHGGGLRSLAYMAAWQQVPELEGYDCVITSGNEPMWWVPKDSHTVVAYTHSPPRWQYDLFHTYETDCLGGIVGTAYSVLSRMMYDHNVRRPDLYVANSDLVARRINLYWNIPEDQIRTVYPPIPTNQYSPGNANTEDYYVTVSRLDGPKRIDQIIKAFNGTDRQLLVAGKGPERDRLEVLADDNVTLLGYVSEERKRELLAGARAFVFAAQNEDFGMAPVEAMAAGTPVLGIAEGFTRFQIVEHGNGLTFDRGAKNIRDAVDEFEREGAQWDADRISEFADQFSVESFRTGMREAVAIAEERSRVSTPWATDLDDRFEGIGADADQEIRLADGGE